MKERPINLKSWEVKAILEGRKTMTRRVLRPQPILEDDGLLRWYWSKYQGLASLNPGVPHDSWIEHCPYGRPGDQLWSRETFALQACVEGEEPPYSDGRPLRVRSDDDVDGVQPAWIQPHYKATDKEPDLCCERGNCGACRDHDFGPHWCSPIQMPRWASRITLEVTGVRVERLQEISEEDALAEGVDPAGPVGYIPASDRMGRARYQYANLWDEINAKRGYGWDANPYVWVIEFKRIEQQAVAA